MNKKEAALLSEEEFFTKLATSAEGLSRAEAAARLKIFGLNQIKKSPFGGMRIFMRQFKSAPVFLLVAATIITFWLGEYSNGAIMAIILSINAVLGFYQEYKSERIAEGLAKLVSKQMLVRRDQKIELVQEFDIVPGDVINFREGDVFAADIRIIAADQLEVNESQLTGESLPVPKKTGEKNSENELLAFAGSTVERGEGFGVVYATGSATELGQIAEVSTHAIRETQYEKSLRSLSTLLVQFVLIGLAIVFMLKLFIVRGTPDMVSLLLFTVAMAVAIVPEALPIVATVSLSRGAMQLAKKHVVVKHLPAVEDLGNITILCTDKTGTITENKMTITKIVSGDEELMLMFAYGSAEPTHGVHTKFVNAYDKAFADYIPDAIKEKCKHLKLIKELPFDPEARRSRSVLLNEENHKYYLVSLGSAETLLTIAKTPRADEYRNNFIAEGKLGLRHFGVAYKEISYGDGFDIVSNEKNLLFLGYAIIADPLRPTAKRAIEDAEKLGVRIKILTGDSREVAEYAGREVGLINGAQAVHTGDELEAMSQGVFAEALRVNNVFARVSPKQKYRIIEELKKTDSVAYQGDGINDAPSLKLADVSIAVQTATDVAKDNSDIILLRKNLEVVVDGIKYGRAIFVNINKYIKYTMISNFGNFIALSALYLLSTNLPLLPIQILLISVISDIPLITISTDSVGETEIVRPEKHNVRELARISMLLGIPTAFFELFYFVIIRNESLDIARTSLYAFLVLIGLIVFFAIRNKGHFWKAKISSFAINVAFLLALLFALGIIYIGQFQHFFSFVPLTASMMGFALIISLFYFLVVDFVKEWYYRAQDSSSLEAVSRG